MSYQRIVPINKSIHINKIKIYKHNLYNIQYLERYTIFRKKEFIANRKYKILILRIY